MAEEARGAWAGFASDLSGGADQLGSGRDANAIASLIASRWLAPPMTIGLFGRPGSGKSFFTRLVANRVEELAGASEGKGTLSDARFVGPVLQVEFNARHHDQGVISLSLAESILGALSADQHRYDLALLRSLPTMSRLIGGAHVRFNTAEEVTNLAKHEAEATDERHRQALLVHADAQAAQKWPTVTRDFARKLGPEQCGSIDADGAKLGIAQLSGTAETFSDILSQGRTVGGRAELLRAVGVTRRVLGTAALFAAVVLLVGAFVFFGFVTRGQIDSFKDQIAVLVGVVGAAATVAAGVGGISARVVQNGAAGALDRLLQHGGTFDTIATRIEVSLEQERSRAAVERDALFSQLTAASERLAAARQSLRIAELERRELVTSDPIPRLLAEYRSLASGSETGASRSLLITLRSDLEALSSLAQVSAQGRLAAYEDSAGLPFPARVVVYVDDLDVCPPNKVVESLETIQTMLRFPMFVAAVSADPTKLQEAIAPWYGMSLDDERRSSDGVDAFFAKVFTFHIWLRQPTAEIARLLMALLPGTAEEVLSPQEVASAVPGTAEEDLSPQEVDSAVPGTAEEDLSPQEIESAVSVAHLLKTPRDARRFVYNYLAARTLVGSSRLQSAEGGCRPLMLLLAVGVSRPDLGWELASAVAPGADSDAAYLSFRERFLREVEPDQLVQEIVDALDDAHPDLTNWARVAQRFSFRGSP